MLRTIESMKAEEDTRMESFRSRGGQIAGFGAVFLGLLGSLLPDGLDDLTGVPCVAGVALFLGGVALVLFSILICLFSVVRPRRRRGISPSRMLARYLSTPALLKAKPWQLELRTLRGLPDVLAWSAWLSQRTAGALYVASASLAAGLFLTASCLVILVLYG